MSTQDWMARYNARKRGQQPLPPPQYAPPPPPPPQQYQQPLPPPVQVPPGYAPQGPVPIPGAPPHAPFGYDQMTGQPMAPYGRDHLGNIIVMPIPHAPPPGTQYYPQQPQQPAYDPRGQVMPQGYGQPPYGPPGGVQQPTAQEATYVGSDGQVHIDWSKAPLAYQGGQGNQESKPCPSCREGFLIPTDATGEARVLNVKTGEFAYPAAHCNRCGYNGVSTPGEASGAVGAAAGTGVKIVGDPRMAPGASTRAQAATSHGLPNLFAPSD